LFALTLVSLFSAAALVGGSWYLQRKLVAANSLPLTLDRGPSANFLILGSDSRAFVENAADAKSFGTTSDVAGQRADVIMVLRLDPVTHHALLVSIPRDLWVRLPRGGAGKINGTYQSGPQGVIDSIRTNLGVPIQHYIELNFAVVRSVADAVGGVPVFVPTPARDHMTGLNVPSAGCQVLDGDQALAWVRSRYYESYQSGHWGTDPTSDLGRIRRQHDFLRQLAQRMATVVEGNPLRLNHLVDVARANVRTDTSLRPQDALRMAHIFRSLEPSQVEMTVLATVPAYRDRQSVLLLQPQADATLARLRGDTSAVIGQLTPHAVSVPVTPGTRTLGRAADPSSPGPPPIPRC
jgi:LCP family protein required for cell wall assembly